MRVVRVEKAGGPEAMQLIELPTPEPGPGEARVRVEAAGVNYIDVYNRNGLYPIDMPAGLGSEGAGVVEAVGEGAGDLSVGDHVAWSGVTGSYASHVIARVTLLVRIPDGVDPRLAAAVMMQGMTAHYLARDTYPLSGKDTCIVHAAAGGVGLLLTQLAKRASARVIGVVSSDEKAEIAKRAGCDDVVVSTRDDFQVESRRITNGVGVDVVYDAVGASTWEQSLRSLRARGMMVTYGNASGPVPAFAPLLLMQLGSLFVTRPRLGDYIATREELFRRASDLFRMIAAHELDVRVHAELPLDRVAEAHRMIESRGTSGKILLIP